MITDLQLPLHTWFVDYWLPKYERSEYIYRDSAKASIMFMRDDLSYLVGEGFTLEQREYELATVVGTHRSKSVELPVVQYARPDLGLQFVLRDNFHDYNLSVISEKAIEPSVMRGFVTEYSEHDKERLMERGKLDCWSYCYFQGFPEDVRFGPYATNPRRFSTYTTTKYEIWTLLFLIMREYK